LLDEWPGVNISTDREAARRLRELDQRDERIEALSAQVRAADKRAIAAERALVARTVAAVGGRVSELERELERWREWKDGIGCVPVAADDDTAMDAIGDRCATLHRIEVILGVEDSDEEGAGYEALRKVVSERDTLRAEASANRRVLKRMRETRIVAANALNETKTTCANQRKELHALNVERKATLTELENTQLELSGANERMERLRLRGIEEDDSYDPYKRLCDIVDEEYGLQPAKLPTGTILSMIENALSEWRKRCGELEAAGKGTTPLSEPAERKPHEGRVYGSAPSIPMTLESMIEHGETCPTWQRTTSTPTHQALLHLRELLDERMAIEAYAESLSRMGPDASFRAAEIREVLNGKR